MISDILIELLQWFEVILNGCVVVTDNVNERKVAILPFPQLGELKSLQYPFLLS